MILATCARCVRVYPRYDKTGKISRDVRAYITSMKLTWETVLMFVAGGALVATLVWVTRLKTRGALRAVVNTLAGGALIAGLSAFNIIVLPFNAFNALIVGLLGLPGAGVVIAAALLL